MNITENLAWRRRGEEHQPALIWQGETFTYRALDAFSSRFANAFSRLGIGCGERVVLALPNGPAFVGAYLGLLKLGAVVVAINPGLKAAEAGFILQDSGARALLASAGLGAGLPLPAGCVRIGTDPAPGVLERV